MDKITEIIPDTIPDWAKEAMDDGQFFRVAVERVEQLEAQLAKEWVSVEKDGFPTDEKPVLVRAPSGAITAACATWVEADGYEGWCWGVHHMGNLDDVSSYEWDDDYTFTDYMPLPKAPE